MFSGRKKKRKEKSVGSSGYLRLPTSAAHYSLALHLHLHLFQALLPTGPSLFCRGKGGEEKRGGGGRKEEANERKERQNCCLLAEGEEWRKCSDHWVMEGERGEEQRNSAFPSAGERRGGGGGGAGATHRTLFCRFAVPLLQFDPKCEVTVCASAPHAHLMWKLTTYSALVRCTEMAKGSKGWKVKATRRRTA